MKDITFGEKLGRSWLTCNYNGRVREYAYLPVQGTHKKCYSAINSDQEIVPAENLDLALITNGAFSRDTPQWNDVKDKCLIKYYTRAPIRLLWMPEKHELAGIILENDLEGEGLSTKMNIPNINGLTNEDGIYVNSDRSVIFVPAEAYKLGKHNATSFERDGFSRAIFTGEGAEIFAKTAVDNKRTPCTFGIDISKIREPTQRVPVFGDCGADRLNLNGNNWNGSNSGFAFGVKKSAKGASQKN